MLRSSVERLRTVGLGEQAIKAAVAAGLAWALGGLVPGAPPQPYLAPLTAVLTVQLTIAESVAGAVQRTLGAIVGVVVALLAGSVIGVNPITVAALVLVAQVIAGVLRLNLIGTSQVIVAALLVLTVGGSTTLAYGWARVAETVVGALVGVGINALLVPPSHLPAARAATTGLVETLTEELDTIARALETGLTQSMAADRLDQARQVTLQVREALAALQRAEQGLRFNFLAATQRDQLDDYRLSVARLEHTGIQVRTLARTLLDAISHPSTAAWLTPAALGKPLAELVRAAAGALRAYPEQGNARQVFANCREALTARAASLSVMLVPNGWESLGSALATLDRLVADLSQQED